MNMLTTFSSDKEPLHDILRSVSNGKTQLPDFQRGWVWDDEHIRSLLASVSLSYPIGAIMTLQTGGEGVHFHPRTIEGVILSNSIEPDRLIMDGQQRLTSLYLSLFSNTPVATTFNNNKSNRWYYLDIDKALSPEYDREDAILSVAEDRIVRNFRGESVADYTTMEKECAAEMFPLPLVFNISKLTAWQME
ncbi:MAG: DUF262 domain-containing protein, partial [Magnetococcales bacterium]|nr:DUF262 domain-containing protein [Magnetococcales bacterium]